MAGLHRIHAELLDDGKITRKEVARIKEYMDQDGDLDYEDIKFLVGLMKDATDVCTEFDELFFPSLSEAILQDGRVQMDEQYLLLQMLYGDGNVRDAERQLLDEIYREAYEISPEFAALCRTAAECHPTNWDLGGKRELAN